MKGVSEGKRSVVMLEFEIKHRMVRIGLNKKQFQQRLERGKRVSQVNIRQSVQIKQLEEKFLYF